MLEVPFGEYLPDLPDYKNPGITAAKNIIPHLKGYLPLKSLSAVTDALDARCRGAAAVRDSDANVYNYAGDATKLYVQSSGSMIDVTNLGGNYSTGAREYWEFVKWGEKVIATNYSDDPQIITMGDANFADLSGSPPRARHIAIINPGFVVMANLNESGTIRPTRVRWSGINDETQWTTDKGKQSDFQDLFSSAPQGGGWIQKVVGGEYGIIFQEDAIWRMDYAGTPPIFNINEIVAGTGTPARNSVVKVGEQIFFLGQDGFYKLVSGSGVVPIGSNRVDMTFLSEIDPGSFDRVWGAADPTQRLIIWIYPGAGSSGGNPNKALIYDWVNDRWGPGEFEAEIIFSSLGAGYTLEELDTLSASLDDLTASLDSREYTGGALQLGAFDTDHKKATFSGPAYDWQLETVEAEIGNGMRAYIDGVRPLIDGDSLSISVQLGSRGKQDEPFSFGASVSPESETNIAHFRNDDRYHRARIIGSGDFNHAIGCQVWAIQSGFR